MAQPRALHITGSLSRGERAGVRASPLGLMAQPRALLSLAPSPLGHWSLHEIIDVSSQYKKKSCDKGRPDLETIALFRMRHETFVIIKISGVSKGVSSNAMTHASGFNHQIWTDCSTQATSPFGFANINDLV